MSNPKQTSKRARVTGARALIFGASLSTIAVVGTASAPLAQSAAEQACAMALKYRTVYRVERVLSQYADDPCVPYMLAALPPHVLRRIDVELVLEIPPEHLRLVPRAVLAILGIDPRFGSSRGIVDYQYGN